MVMFVASVSHPANPRIGRHDQTQSSPASGVWIADEYVAVQVGGERRPQPIGWAEPAR
jgi:hypothetical protein